MPINVPQYKFVDYNNAIGGALKNRAIQAQTNALNQQNQLRSQMAPVQMQSAQTANDIQSIKSSLMQAKLVNDPQSYEILRQHVLRVTPDFGKLWPQKYNPAFMDKLTGQLEQKAGQSPSSIQTYKFYQKQHPEYKGDFLQFQTDLANAKTPQGETPPAVTEAYKNGVLQGNMTLRNVPIKDRPAVAIALNNMPKGAFSPQAITKFTQAAERIQSNFIKLPQYQLTANAVPYLQRIDAAIKNPGSVSDQDLIDSLTKLTTGGNQVTEQQIKTVTGGKTFGDWLNIIKNKSVNQGGVFSDNQRKQIDKVAKTIFQHYQKGWQPVYKKLTAQLKQANIPQQFWSLPDLNQLSAQGGYPMEGTAQPQGAPPSPQPAQQPSIDDLVNKYANP